MLDSHLPPNSSFQLPTVNPLFHYSTPSVVRIVTVHLSLVLFAYSSPRLATLRHIAFNHALHNQSGEKRCQDRTEVRGFPWNYPYHYQSEGIVYQRIEQDERYERSEGECRPDS